jgi:hypothetical protein
MLEPCLQSLLKLDYPRKRLEIIVVDNASTDGSQQLVRQTPFTKLVALSRNEGFAPAVNVGVRESTGEFVALVNNDVELSAKWLQTLLTDLLRDPKLAAATGKLLFKNQPNVVNDLGAIVLLNGAGIHRGLGTADTVTHRTATYVGAASGAACLIRKSAYFAVEGFDESYFAYFEDVDLGWRFWQSGFKVICDSSATAYHSWQVTSRKFGTSFRVYHCAKNSFATWLKNTQRQLLAQAFLLWFLRLLLEVARSVKRRDAKSIPCIIKSLEWCSTNLRSILAQRRMIQRCRVVGDSALIRSGVLGGLGEALQETLRLHRLGIDLN